ncbi:hypothetical protein [Herbaspirillum seropedicae]|uniref:hypothetical protein n=1 Tax=Herbaspirillum seropedicae TaxID=964 RepID=UPI003FCD2446
MATKSNVTKVQVPGEAAAPAADQFTDLEQDQAAAGADTGGIDAADLPSAGGADSVDVDAMQAQLDAKDAELAELKAMLAKSDAKDGAPKKIDALRHGPGGRNDFKHLHSKQIDVATLKRPIQCADGWLVPKQITQNDKG